MQTIGYLRVSKIDPDIEKNKSDILLSDIILSVWLSVLHPRKALLARAIARAGLSSRRTRQERERGY